MTLTKKQQQRAINFAWEQREKQELSEAILCVGGGFLLGLSLFVFVLASLSKVLLGMSTYYALTFSLMPSGILMAGIAVFVIYKVGGAQ